ADAFSSGPAGGGGRMGRIRPRAALRRNSLGPEGSALAELRSRCRGLRALLVWRGSRADRLDRDRLLLRRAIVHRARRPCATVLLIARDGARRGAALL